MYTHIVCFFMLLSDHLFSEAFFVFGWNVCPKNSFLYKLEHIRSHLLCFYIPFQNLGHCQIWSHKIEIFLNTQKLLLTAIWILQDPHTALCCISPLLFTLPYCRYELRRSLAPVMQTLQFSCTCWKFQCSCIIVL